MHISELTKIRGDDGAGPQAPVALNPLPVGDVYWL